MEDIGFNLVVEQKKVAEENEKIENAPSLPLTFFTVIALIAMIGVGIFIGFIIWGNKSNQNNYQSASQQPSNLMNATTGSSGENTDNWTQYSDSNFAIKYPANWMMKKGFAAKDDLVIYDPRSIKQVNQNGKQARMPGAYIDIAQVTSATQSAAQIVENYKQSMKKQNSTLQSEQSPTVGINLVLLADGKVDVSGNSIFMTNKNMLAVFNASIQHLTENSTENHILQTFQFIPQ